MTMVKEIPRKLRLLWDRIDTSFTAPHETIVGLCVCAKWLLPLKGTSSMLVYCMRWDLRVHSQRCRIDTVWGKKVMMGDATKCYFTGLISLPPQESTL